MENYYDFMKLAIEEGKKSKSEDGKSSPKVGAVLIKDGKLIEKAHRGELGSGDHAEYTLLKKKLGDIDVSGSILLTTLEPCTHRNTRKTCSEWIIEKKLAEVYIGMLDPNPKIYNKGYMKLKKANINIEYFPHELRNEIKEDNIDFLSQYKENKKIMGIADFDYSNNDGKFIIGQGDYFFETKWSKGSDKCIHILNYPTSIKTVAYAEGAEEITDIKDATIFDASSKYRTIYEGQIAVLENKNGYFAAVKVIDVKDKNRKDLNDELIFEYHILSNKGINFSRSL